MTGIVDKFACGHVGRLIISDRAKMQAFIRVAEIRGAFVEVSDKPCPDCKGKDNAV